MPRAVKALEQDGWVLLSQVQRPGQSCLVIDYIAIGPGGVVVIDSRHWVGRIEVTRGVVQQNGFWREQECAAVARTAGAVAALLLPQHRTAVHAMICVVQHELAEHLISPGVHVVGVNELGRALRAMPYRLPPAAVSQLRTVLSGLLLDAVPPNQLTTAELDERPAAGYPVGAHREVIDLQPSTPFISAPGRFLRDPAPATPRRRRNPRLILVRTLLVALLVAAALLVGPGLFRGVTAEPQPQQPPVPVASLVDPSSGGASVVGAGTTTPLRVQPEITGAPVRMKLSEGSGSPGSGSPGSG